jgi:hypothetical protein
MEHKACQDAKVEILGAPAEQKEKQIPNRVSSLAGMLLSPTKIPPKSHDYRWFAES